jgi:Tfp pilus assembly protein PilN
MKPVNLLPDSERRRAPASDSKIGYIALGVLCALLLMTASYVIVGNSATGHANDAAAARAEADQLEARATQIGAFGDFATIKQTRLASVSQLATSRFDWERLMRELARVLPAGGWLKTAKASTSGAPEGANASATTATTGPTAVLNGCMPHQSDVAALMLRLERMNRVEDVSLQASTRTSAGAAASLESCGKFFAFDLTVSFSAIQDPREAPDGRRSVPVSLGGGS